MPPSSLGIPKTKLFNCHYNHYDPHLQFKEQTVYPFLLFPQLDLLNPYCPPPPISLTPLCGSSLTTQLRIRRLLSNIHSYL